MAYKTYKGKFKVKNTDKYIGDHTKVVYRSLWERNTFRWIDANPDIVEWNSEEVVIPYRCETDKRMHRYFVDVYYKDRSGAQYLVEIKPKKETIPPKVTRRSRRSITEALTYIKNQSKWRAAEEFCDNRGWHFVIWHEDVLKSMGIKILK